MIGDIKRLLLIPHLKVHNANALSSAFTIGFPAMTAWLGATHALQRKLNAGEFPDLRFSATAIISHHCDLQTHKGVGDFVRSIVIPKRPSFTRKELTKFNAGKAPTFIEEARCHLDVSLLLEYTGTEKNDETPFLERVSQLLNSSMKIAGGDIFGFNSPLTLKIEEGNDTDLRKLTRKLMPGHAIVERRELMVDAVSNGQGAMDALLDYLTIHHNCEQDESGNVSWSSTRRTSGWIVPIATGFHALTEAEIAKNQRDENTPHRFAESIVTLGEFKMPHRINSLNEILWRYHVEPDQNLYLCQQQTSFNS